MRKIILFAISIVSFTSFASETNIKKTEPDIVRFKYFSDTINILMNRLWPLNQNPEAEKRRSQYNFISSVTERNDTMLILSNNPKLFCNDYYTFKTKNEIINAFPEGNTRIIFDPKEEPVFNGAVVSADYGDIKDSLNYTGKEPFFFLDSGELATNRLFTISKHCKIDTPIEELFEYLGLKSLGIPIPETDGNIYGYVIIIDPNLEDLDAPELHSLPINGHFNSIYIYNNKIWIYFFNQIQKYNFC